MIQISFDENGEGRASEISIEDAIAQAEAATAGGAESEWDENDTRSNEELLIGVAKAYRALEATNPNDPVAKIQKAMDDLEKAGRAAMGRGLKLLAEESCHSS